MAVAGRSVHLLWAGKEEKSHLSGTASSCPWPWAGAETRHETGRARLGNGKPGWVVREPLSRQGASRWNGTSVLWVEVNRNLPSPLFPWVVLISTEPGRRWGGGTCHGNGVTPNVWCAAALFTEQNCSSRWVLQKPAASRFWSICRNG